MTVYTQQDRRLLLATPLGPDALLLSKFQGAESLSQLFSFQLELLSEHSSLSPKSIVGKPVTFGIQRPDGDTRYFNGIVRSFSYHGTDDRLSLYRAQVVPWLWFLTLTTDCRIFQNKTTLEILEQIFTELGFSDFDKSQVSGTHPRWDYRVQYQESDFSFISRLLEQDGIFYYFRHENGKHILVLADKTRAYKDAPEKQVAFAPNNLSEVDPNDLITSWEHRYEFRSGRLAHTDYNFTTPSTSLAANSRSIVPFDGADKLELFEYPGLYDKKPDGESFAKIRMEEQEVNHETVLASSRCRTFSPGLKFTLSSHHHPDEEGISYVVTSIQHSAAQPGSYVSGADMPPEEYSNQFTCIPASVSFRPPRSTPKPSVQGVQTAVVVGPPGQEIYTDKFGRIKVQFFWDRLGKRNENSSCWIRVAQAWAGKNWGTIFLPRIDQEVIVSFVDGDPDRPLITGSVYNADQMPPYALPENKTISTTKSNSSTGGNGFNEIKFEDKSGHELVYIQAQKDRTVLVKNDNTETVQQDESIHVVNNRTKSVDQNETTTIGVNRNETVGSDETINIGADRTENVGGSETIEVSGSRSMTVDGNETYTVGGSRTETVAMMEIDTVGMARVTTTVAAHIETTGLLHAQIVGVERIATIGDSDSIACSNYTLTAYKTAVIDCPDITLKAGKNFIHITSAGITVQGAILQLNPGASPPSTPPTDNSKSWLAKLGIGDKTITLLNTPFSYSNLYAALPTLSTVIKNIPTAWLPKNWQPFQTTLADVADYANAQLPGGKSADAQAALSKSIQAGIQGAEKHYGLDGSSSKGGASSNSAGSKKPGGGGGKGGQSNSDPAKDNSTNDSNSSDPDNTTNGNASPPTDTNSTPTGDPDNSGSNTTDGQTGDNRGDIGDPNPPTNTGLA